MVLGRKHIGEKEWGDIWEETHTGKERGRESKRDMEK